MNVSKILSANGKWKIDETGKLVVEEIETQKLKVGSPEQPQRITIYDQATKQPGCVTLVNGSLQVTPGECGTTPPAPSPTPAPHSEPPAESSNPPAEEPLTSTSEASTTLETTATSTQQ